MKVSIITVCYNSEKTIRRTIHSVLSQDYSQIEYLIIDGNSKDNTVEIAHSFEREFIAKNIQYKIISEPDKGIYDAMNKGILNATGDIIGIINSDDYLATNDVISSVVKCFESQKTQTLYGNIIVEKNGKPYRYWKSGKPRTFKFGWMPPHPAFFVKKEVYSQFGVFRLDCGVNADYELMLRLLEKQKVTTFWLNKTITIMAAGGASNNGINSRLQGISDNKQAWIVNDMKLPFFTVYLKKIRKIHQFISAKFVKIK